MKPLTPKSKQSQCRDCRYIWYPAEKREKCPKCKSTNVAYTSGLGRLFLAMILLVLLLGAAAAGGWWIFIRDDTKPPEQIAGPEPSTPPQTSTPEEVVPTDPDPPLEETTEEPTAPGAPKPLTSRRTWTARDGRTLEASLLRLELVEGRYVGHFERPDGETFTYKIGNLSPADVELVKGIVEKE